MTQEEMIREAMKNQTVLTSYAFSILRDWSLAEDAFQETLVDVTRRWSTFVEGGNLLGWLSGIIRNEALEIIRSRKNIAPLSDEEINDLIDKQFELHLTAEVAENVEATAARLRECVRALDNRARKMLLGFYYESSSCRAIAKSMRMHEPAVRLALFRLRERLRKCVVESEAVS